MWQKVWPYIAAWSGLSVHHLVSLQCTRMWWTSAEVSIFCCKGKEQRLKKQLKLEEIKRQKPNEIQRNKDILKRMRYKTIWKNKSNHRMFNDTQIKLPKKWNSKSFNRKNNSAKTKEACWPVNDSRHSSSEDGKSWRDTVQPFSQRSQSKHKWMLTKNSCT